MSCTDISEFTLQGRKKRTVRYCGDKRYMAIKCVFCRDLHLTLMFSGRLRTDPFKGRCSLAASFFKQNWHACHTRFADFFPLPSCCVCKFTIVLPIEPVSFLMFQLPSPSPIPLSKTVSCNFRWSMVTKPFVTIDLIGSLSNYDDDHNDDFKKQ